MQLRAFGPVVTVDVTNARSEKVHSRADELVDIVWVGQDSFVAWVNHSSFSSSRRIY